MSENTSSQPAVNENADGAVENKRFAWGAAEIGALINRNERQVYRLLETGQIQCARKKGNAWCAPVDAVLKEYGVS